MGKRVVLFVVVNLAVMLVFGVAYSLFVAVTGIKPVGVSAAVVTALLFGMGGALVSLALSKPLAKWSTGARVIVQPVNAAERWLLATVARQAAQVGIGMPEVAIYDAPEMNAFATGMRRHHALVAVSSGLLQGMDYDEVEAVLAHEVSHVANGDMVTLALIQGVLNTLVILLARLVGGLLTRSDEEEQEGGGLAQMGVTLVLELVFGLLASVVVMWFSRQREYRADAGGARLAGRGKMIAALERLQADQTGSTLPQELAAFGLAGRGSLFMSHPPLPERIAVLRRQEG